LQPCSNLVIKINGAPQLINEPIAKRDGITYVRDMRGFLESKGGLLFGRCHMLDIHYSDSISSSERVKQAQLASHLSEIVQNRRKLY
jgi:hypothetical protein